jgi:hypothetical protein
MQEGTKGNVELLLIRRVQEACPHPVQLTNRVAATVAIGPTDLRTEVQACLG